MSELPGLPRYAVLDGGMATELVRQGHTDIDSDPLWSCRLLKTNMADVEAVHRGFIEAGSQIIETNTYQASIAGFVKYLGVSEKEAVELIQHAVHCACKARQKTANNPGSDDVLIAGSVGPYGASQHDGSEYTGKYVESMSIQDLVEWHCPVVSALVTAGVDILAFDTIPAQVEAEAICQLLEESYSKCRAWISFSCRDGEHTAHGERLVDAVQCITNCSQVVGIGINCTDPAYITQLLRSIKGHTVNKILIVYPNSGETWNAELGEWEAGGARQQALADYVEEWISAGAQWIGGCCRSTCHDIAAIKTVMKKHFTS